MSVNKEISQNLENIRKFVDRRTKLKAKEFRRKTLLAKRQDENLRRREKETILEAPKLVQSFPGRSALTNIAGRGKGFLERILKFISFLAAGWVFRNISTIIGYGKEFFARLNKAREILTNMVKAIGDTFKSLGKVFDAALTNLVKFDFNDSEKRLENAWKEVTDNVNEIGKEYDEGVKLLTTPLLDAEYRGSYSGEFVPPFVGEERTPPPAVEPTTTATTTPQANRGTGRDGTFGQGTYGQGRPTDGTPTTSSVPTTGGGGILKPLLDLISSGESPRGGYAAMFPSEVYPQILNMTISEVIEFQKLKLQDGRRSAAIGRYQMLYPEDYAAAAGLSLSAKFSPANQDKMVIAYLKKYRRLDEWLQGRITDEAFSEELAREFGTFRSASGYVLPNNTGSIGFDQMKVVFNKIKGVKKAKIQPLNNMMNIAKIDDKTDAVKKEVFGDSSPIENASSLLENQNIAFDKGSADKLKFKDNYLDFVKSNVTINFDALPKELQETIKQERKRPKVIIARQAPSISPQVTSSGTEETITIDTSSMVNTLIKKQNLTRLAYT